MLLSAYAEGLVNNDDNKWEYSEIGERIEIIQTSTLLRPARILEPEDLWKLAVSQTPMKNSRNIIIIYSLSFSTSALVDGLSLKSE